MMINKIKNIAILSLTALSLSSCKLYSDYQREDKDVAQVDSLFRFIEATQDTTTIASLHWSELFTDPYLQSLIKEGLKNNNNLQVGQLNVEMAEVVVRNSRLAFAPSVALQPQGNMVNYQGVTVATYNVSVAASWEIDIFGSLRNAKESSKMALESSRAYGKAMRTSLISSIASSYYSLLMLDEQLAISEQTLATWDENIRVMRALKKAGMTTETAVLQSEANKVALEASIETVKQNIHDLEGAICLLVGAVPTSVKRGKLSDATFPEQMSIGVPIQLLSNRPDVQQAEYNLAQMFYNTNVARSAFYPKITLSGSAGFTNNPGVIVNPGDWVLNAVASLVQPIFNKGLIKGQYKIAQIKEEQAVLQFREALLQAGQEVNSALGMWQTAQKRKEFTAQQVEMLEKAVRNSELMMKNSNSSYLEVLTAQFSLLNAQLTYSSEQYNQIAGVINLYRSLGGGAK